MPLRARTKAARHLRRNSADAERILWQALRAISLPWRFRRQRPIGRFIVDFACSARKLAIELDGGQHAEKEAADAERTLFLGCYGYHVIRFWNNEVLENLGGVMETIMCELADTPTSPQPSPPPGAERGKTR